MTPPVRAMQDVASTRTRADVLAEMFARIAAGESVASICRSGGDFPTDTTFWRWLQDEPGALDCYERATAARGNVYAERIYDVTADLKADPDLTLEKIQLAKLTCDNLKWNASRMLPRRFGDRTIVSGDPDNPVELRHTVAGKLLPELAARDSAGTLVSIDGGRAGSPGLRVGNLLGASRTTDATGAVDVLADQSRPGVGKDAKRS